MEPGGGARGGVVFAGELLPRTQSHIKGWVSNHFQGQWNHLSKHVLVGDLLCPFSLARSPLLPLSPSLCVKQRGSIPRSLLTPPSGLIVKLLSVLLINEIDVRCVYGQMAAPPHCNSTIIPVCIPNHCIPSGLPIAQTNMTKGWHFLNQPHRIGGE